MISVRQVARRILGSAVAWSFGVGLVRVLGFVVVMAFALRILPTTDIGLWYVMANSAGLAVAVDFGFSITVSRFASYFWAGAESISRVGLPPRVRAGERANLDGLADLIRMAQPFYACLGILSGTGLLISGVVWCVLSGRTIGPWERTAFTVLALGTGASVAGMFWMAILQGIHEVTAWSRFLFAGLTVGYLVTFAGLGSGLGLLALVLGLVTTSLVPLILARRRVRQCVALRSRRVSTPVGWRDLWPISWRSGLATLTSYLRIQSTTLVCAAVTDLETTASYGLSIQAALFLHLVSASWLAVKHPLISSIRVQGRTVEAIPMIRTRIAAAMLTYMVGALGLLMVVPRALGLIGSQTHLLPPMHMVALLGMIGLDLFVGLHAAVLQTANRVPHMRSFAISGVATVILAVGSGSLWGVAGVIAAPVAAQIPMNYWWVAWRCWRELQSESDYQESTIPSECIGTAKCPRAYSSLGRCPQSLQNWDGRG